MCSRLEKPAEIKTMRSSALLYCAATGSNESAWVCAAQGKATIQHPDKLNRSPKQRLTTLRPNEEINLYMTFHGRCRSSSESQQAGGVT